MLEQTTMPKNNLGRSGLILVYSSTSQSVTEGNEGRDLESGADGEAKGEFCLLACSFRFPGPPAQERHCPQQAGPSHINH